MMTAASYLGLASASDISTAWQYMLRLFCNLERGWTAAVPMRKKLKPMKAWECLWWWACLWRWEALWRWEGLVFPSCSRH